jgi:LasA protease
MKGSPPQPEAFGWQFLMPGRMLIGWFGLLALILITALACNLPSHQTTGLIFTTDRPFATATATSLIITQGTIQPVEGLDSIPTAQSPGGVSTLFQGIQTATPGPAQPASWITPDLSANLPPLSYITQAGDSLSALATRFGVRPDQITPAQPTTGLLIPGQPLTIPNLLGQPPYPSAVLPDSIVIYSPSATDFQIEAYITQAGGYLSTYTEKVDNEYLRGFDIVRRVAVESSINPQLLLAILEFRSGWVRGQPYAYTQLEYPIGFYVPEYKGLYMELSLAAKELNFGYYGWREGSLTDLPFPDGSHVRVSPALNAGSVAMQVLTGMFYLHQSDWVDALYGTQGITALYDQMFGDPWQAAATTEPLFPAGVTQPVLELPFTAGEYWSLTSGPHISWRTGTPRGALDFAPITGEPACAVSRAWVTASAAGRVVRSERGVVALDLDGDGLEQTGWVLVYMHIAEQERVPLGAWVETNRPIGHPSCEGGTATGTNIHLARKYNGEWLAADGPLPMVLSGWVAHQGELSYEGTLEKDGQIVTARPDGSAGSTIIR